MVKNNFWADILEFDVATIILTLPYMECMPSLADDQPYWFILNLIIFGGFLPFLVAAQRRFDVHVMYPYMYTNIHVQCTCSMYSLMFFGLHRYLLVVLVIIWVVCTPYTYVLWLQRWLHTPSQAYNT